MSNAEMKPHIMTFGNQKGGVGKSTLSYHYSYYCADKGFSVAHIDNEHQGNSSKTLSDFATGYTAHDVFDSSAEIDFSSLNPEKGKVSLFAGGDEMLKVNKMADSCLLTFKRNVEKLREIYDVIVIDTPPDIGNRLYGAILVTDFIITPIDLNAYSLDGVSKMVELIRGFSSKYNPEMKYLGMIANRVNNRSETQKETFKELYKKYNQYFFKHPIAERTAYGDALKEKAPIFHLDAGREAKKELLSIFAQIEEKIA